MDAKITPVSEFPAPREEPLSYPGRRPNHSFVTDGRLVYPVDFEGNSIKSARVWLPEGAKPLDDYLKGHGLAPVGDRFPVIGFGSNACPGQLRSKFGESEIIPVIRANIIGWDAVYNFMSKFGYAFAELMPQAPTGLDVAVTLLDERQVPVMNSTEGHYALSVFPQLKFESSETINALGYAGTSKIFRSSTYKGPVALAEIAAMNRKLTALSQKDMLELGIRELGLDKQYAISTAEELADLIRSPIGVAVKDYVEVAVADGHSLNESTASLVEQLPDPGKPASSLDDLLKAAA